MQSDQVGRGLRARSCRGRDQTAPGGRRPPFGVHRCERENAFDCMSPVESSSPPCEGRPEKRRRISRPESSPDAASPPPVHAAACATRGARRAGSFAGISNRVEWRPMATRSGGVVPLSVSGEGSASRRNMRRCLVLPEQSSEHRCVFHLVSGEVAQEFCGRFRRKGCTASRSRGEPARPLHRWRLPRA